MQQIKNDVVSKKIQISILNEIYGKLLTEKQQVCIEDYYNNDLSLSEIAENNDITRQAVRDNLKLGEKKLFEYEAKLQISKKIKEQKKELENLIKDIEKIETEEVITKKQIESLKNKIIKLI